MPDMVSAFVSRAKSMLEGGRVARGHEVFGQQGRPRLWHDRLETQFFRRLVRGLGSSLSRKRRFRSSRTRTTSASGEAKCEEAEWRRENGLGIDFALPGSNSALRAERPDNPRNLPCPSRGRTRRLATSAIHAPIRRNGAAIKTPRFPVRCWDANVPTTS